MGAAGRFLGRLGSVVGGALAVAVFMLLASVGDAGFLGPAVGGVLVAFLGGQAIVSRLPRRAAIDQWPAVPAYVPAAPHVPGSPRQVALALAGPESRELVLSAAFGAGVALLVTVFILFGLIWSDDTEGKLLEVAQLTPIFVHPLVGMVIVAAHRSRTRSRRDLTEELFAACPTSQDTRNRGHLATAWVPAVCCVAFGFLMVGTVATQVEQTWGPFGSGQVLAILSAGVLGVGGVSLAVGLARWAPWPIAPIVAIVAIGAVTIELATAGGADEREPLRGLSTFLGDPDINYRLVAPHHLARVGWLVSLVVLVAALGLLKDRRGSRLVVLAGGAAVAAAAFAVATARPIDEADAERIAAMLLDPAAHQECLDVHGVSVCAWQGDGPLAELIAGEIAPVAAAVPTGVLDGVTFAPDATVNLADLDPEVRARLDPAAGRLRDGVLPATMGAHHETLEGARLWAALAAVGVTDDWRHGSTLVIADEARGVVAIWLATREASTGTVRNLTSYEPNPEVDHGENESRPWPSPCYAGPAPVRWAVADIGAARLLLDVPAAEVQALLDTRWAWATDPSTTTAELLAAVGLEPTAPAGALTRSTSC